SLFRSCARGEVFSGIAAHWKSLAPESLPVLVRYKLRRHFASRQERLAWFAKSGHESEKIFHEHGHVSQSGCRRHRRFLSRGWGKGGANDPLIARLSHRRSHVPRSHPATRGPISPRRS